MNGGALSFWLSMFVELCLFEGPGSFQAVVVVVAPILANKTCELKNDNVGEQKLTAVDSMKVPSVCYQNNELWSLAQKEQRDFVS